jgi:hypothetical protein
MRKHMYNNLLILRNISILKLKKEGIENGGPL